MTWRQRFSRARNGSIGFLLLRRCLFFYFSWLCAKNDTKLTSSVHRLAILEFVVLKIGAFFRAVRYAVVTRYGNVRMRHMSDRMGAIGSLGSFCWTLILSVGLFSLMEEYDVDLVLGGLALVRASEIDFGVAEKPVWFPFNSEDGIVYDPRTFKDPGRSVITHHSIPVQNQDEWRDKEMAVAFAQAALDHYLRDGTDLFHISSLAEQT